MSFLSHDMLFEHVWIFVDILDYAWICLNILEYAQLLTSRIMAAHRPPVLFEFFSNNFSVQKRPLASPTLPSFGQHLFKQLASFKQNICFGIMWPKSISDMCHQSHFLFGVSYKAERYQDQQSLKSTTNSWTDSRELAADGFLSESAGAASLHTQLFVFVAGIVRKSRLAQFLRKVSTDI